MIDANDAIYDGEDNVKAFYRQGQVGVLSYNIVQVVRFPEQKKACLDLLKGSEQ